MNGIVISRIPGFREAVAEARRKQSLIRENAWKKIPKDIFGFKLRVMTVCDYLILDHYESPFLYRTEPRIEDLAFLLWVLSPECERWNHRRLQIFRSLAAYFYSRKVIRRLGKNIPENHEGIPCFQSAIKSVFSYIDEMFIDAPASISNGTDSPVCYLASWFGLMQSEYHFSESEVYSMPLPQLFQRVKESQMRKGEKVPAFNRFEDRLKEFIQRGIAASKFTYQDLADGKVKFELN